LFKNILKIQIYELNIGIRNPSGTFLKTLEFMVESIFISIKKTGEFMKFYLTNSFSPINLLLSFYTGYE